MQIQQKSSLMIINENNQLLQKLPEYLSKHIEIYQNMHKDIDPSDQSSMAHFRSREGNTEGYVKQFVNISAEFVDTVSRLRSNFIALTKRYGEQSNNKQRLKPSDPEKQNISNFDLFVSEHCENSAKQHLKNACTPQIKDEDFNKFLNEELI